MRYTYRTFNTDNWDYNINRFFFPTMLGLLYEAVVLYKVNFDVSVWEVLLRVLVSWTIPLFFCALIESVFATVVKVGLEPGSLLESKLTTLKVFPKTFVNSYFRFMTGFKQVNGFRTIVVQTNPYVIGSLGHDGVIPAVITAGINDTVKIHLLDYIKKPDNFN